MVISYYLSLQTYRRSAQGHSSADRRYWKRKEKYQVLLGVTGSGKTFTMANVIAAIGETYA
jgi:excinuclease UvrABC helicase subunit UvrB